MQGGLRGPCRWREALATASEVASIASGAACWPCPTSTLRGFGMLGDGDAHGQHAVVKGSAKRDCHGAARRDRPRRQRGLGRLGLIEFDYLHTATPKA